MDKNGIITFSGFDGISGNHIALDRAGVKVKTYIASELLVIKGKINPAIRITQHNYPKTIQLGDISRIDGYSLRGTVNLFAGGSPCQSFSNAGDRKGFDGKSKLFFEWLRLKNEMNPDYWILENVRMKPEWKKFIDDTLGVEGIVINSSVISAQNRPRIYWTNIPYTPIEDHGILLGDVIPGAITGVSKHGKHIPENLRVHGGPKWKNIGWEPNMKNKANCLVTSRGHYKNIQGKIIPFCIQDAEALQTVPKGYTDVPGVSMTDCFHALGNGWTIDVLVEAFYKNLPWATKVKVQPKGKFVKL
jgi:site-specific DNA-cytosine methylase